MDKQEFTEKLLCKIGELTESMNHLVNKFLMGQLRIKKLEESLPKKILLKPSEEIFLPKEYVIDKINELLMNVGKNEKARTEIRKLIDDIKDY